MAHVQHAGAWRLLSHRLGSRHVRSNVNGGVTGQVPLRHGVLAAQSGATRWSVKASATHCYPEARRSSPSRRGEAESGGAERPPVLDASLDAIKAALPSDPVVDAAAEIISTETIAEGEPITAADAL